MKTLFNLTVIAMTAMAVSYWVVAVAVFVEVLNEES